MISNFLSITGMIVTAIGFVAWSRLRLGRVWWPLLAGAGLWVIAVALKFAWAIPVNTVVATWLVTTLGRDVGVPLVWIYIGLLTGVFECGAIYLAVRFIPWLRAFDSNRALALGFGFGAVEALLIGLGGLIPTVMFLIDPASLAPEVAAHVKPLDWAILPAPTIERIATIFVHGLTTYLIFYAIRFGAAAWFWAAFAIKSAIDAVAAWGQLSLGIDTPDKIWTLEAIVIVFGIGSAWGLVVMRRRWAAAASATP